MSVDDLEKRLRMVGISNIEDVKYGTTENNGEFGYELYPEAKPITKKDMELMLKSYLPKPNRDVSSGVKRISLEGDQTESHRDEVPTQLQ
ncbi:YetF domain-containing protein [Paenibacillus sp. M-152]|uniref:YetF domain-containing protein n=1 Tax=Paenibacillus sp. M-152 TaxID=2487928 RepID=UPI001F0BE9C1|nr:YetF domain-containing protein [Paenibacillus sp. M-152]